MDRRIFWRWSLVLCRRHAGAREDWPSRPVTLVVPFAPGGVYDTLGARPCGSLSRILGQPIVVENVPGAGGMAGGRGSPKPIPTATLSVRR